MGLDQYLYAKRFASGSPYGGAEDRELFASIMELVKVDEYVDVDFPSAHIGVKVAYWRKANAIHSWFVQNCQEGEDNCQTVYVPREQLAELRDVCRKVLADPSLASELLPTADGFFFGGTDYDEWYLNSLRYTALTLDKLLTMPEDWGFEYSSSW